MFENHANLWQEIARQSPERTALVAGERRFSYGAFDEAAGRAAAYLQGRGVGGGDVVAFYLHNTAEFLILFYACLKLEAIPAPMNYRYRAAEVVELAEISTPKALIYRSSVRAEARAAQEQVLQSMPEQAPEVWVEVDDSAWTSPAEQPAETAGPASAVPVEELLSFEQVLEHRTVDRDAELYIFTGGTTGRPKAVVWSLGGLMDIQVTSTYTPLGITPPESLQEAVGIATDPDTPHVVTLPLAPFIHATALFMSGNTLTVGGTVVVNPNPSLDAAAAAELTLAEGVTELIVAGDAVAQPVSEALAAHPGREGLRLNAVMSSGMRFSDETKARLHGLGEVTIIDVLASTEGGPFAMGITRSEDDLPARFKLAAEAVVLDEKDREVQQTPGSTGILAFRGALPKGYLNEPEKSRETYPVISGKRHVKPGDYVQVDEGGYIEFLGRGSAVINTGGEKVYPAEVEEALLTHQAVHDAVVFGLPDQRLGERVSAVVAVDDSEALSPEELQSWVAQQLAGYKKPRSIAIRQQLERTPAGKLNMRRVKEVARSADADQQTVAP
ncbi:AMP-binding protein [Nesterenkonia cremea]|uniref:Fatty-acid-CoA ligase FadD n=1 Tax=Nesterenkonia cremea TaxID=1882340 RepID=A0A917EPP8_9MICC|nr:AMP-binding protein [Nesterenkonia cremea]GGE63372.1 putative fatty-acid-CoA ligase FadD [Nesterenkonia cremea]